MGFEDAARYMGIGISAWLLALAVLVAYQLLTGVIPLHGMLRTGGQNPSGKADPNIIDTERVQLLITFLIGVAFYIKAGAVALNQTTPLTAMPEPPGLLGEVLLASNAIYLAGKYGRKLQQRGAS